MEKHKIIALHIAKDLPLKKIKALLEFKLLDYEKKVSIYSVRDNSYIFIYSFGAIFFYNVDEKTINKTLEIMKSNGISIFSEKLREKYEEDYVVVENSTEKVGFEEVHLKQPNLESVRILAWVISRSVALDHYEAQVDDMMGTFSRFNRQLKLKGKLNISSKNLLKIIGSNNFIIESIISKLSILEEPAATWENEKLDWLFNKLYELFEIEERFEIIEHKVNYLQNISNTLLEAKRNKKEVILELTIIILIFIEVIMFAYELWFPF